MSLSVRLAAAAAILPLLAAFRCNQTVEPEGFSMPAATQTGANTIGFVLDGQVWRDYGQRCTALSSQCDSNQVRVRQSPFDGTSYELHAGLSIGERSELFLVQLRNLHRPGTYTPSSPGYRSGLPALQVDFDRREGGTNVTYAARRGTPFQVTITRLDTISRIISGTFEGTLRNAADTTRTLTMRDGRFDVRYRR